MLIVNTSTYYYPLPPLEKEQKAAFGVDAMSTGCISIMIEKKVKESHWSWLGDHNFIHQMWANH